MNSVLRWLPMIAPRRRIGVGIIGFGRIGAEHCGLAGGARAAARRGGRRRHARPAGAGPQARLEGFPDAEAMLGDDGVQAVLVATPTAMHFEHVMLALSAGRHVLVEKPMALDLAQSRQMTEEAERRGLVLSVFHNRRWDVDYLTRPPGGAGRDVWKVINVESRLGQFSSCVGPAARDTAPTGATKRLSAAAGSTTGGATSLTRSGG